MSRGGLIEHSWLITAEDAVQLDPVLSELRTRVRGNNLAVDHALRGIHALAVSVTRPACVDDFRLVESAQAVPTLKSWMTTKQAADFIGVTPSAVRQAGKEGRLRGERIEDRWRFLEEDVRVWRAAREAQEKANGY